jgi:dynein regulatory complex protein 1
MDGNKKLSKAERIEQRRKRVEAKRNVKDSDSSNKDDSNFVEESSKSKTEVTNARAIVDAALYTAHIAVTSVKVDRENKEAERRRKEAANRKTRLEKLEKDLLESTKENREIEAQWIEVAKKIIPQDLHQEIGKQFQQASNVLNKKHELVKELQKELKEQDEEYVELLAQHQEDVVSMVKKMQDEFYMYLKTCEKQLDNVEVSFLEERKELLEQNKREIDELFKKREALENDIVKKAGDREKQFQDVLAKVRSDDAEDYTSLKVTLENNIQLLEQQLEQMRATYQLNSEKLEYNHSVLEERDAENKLKLDHHRQRHRQLKEALSSAIQKHHKEDHETKQVNKQLTEDFARVSESYKDLQKKFRHFEMSDQVKFKEVWDMNENTVMELVKKVLRADKIIYEQILGIDWKCPISNDDDELLTDVESITPEHIFNSVSDSDRMDRIAMKSITKTIFNNTSAGGNADAAAGSSDESTAVAAVGAAGAATGSRKAKYSSSQVKMVLSILANECSFLVDNRVKESIKGLKEEEQRLFKVDAILMALSIGDGEDLEELISYIIEGSSNGTNNANNNANNNNGSGSNAAINSADKSLVHPNDVVKNIKEWIVIRQNTKAGAGLGIVSKANASVEDDKMAKKKEKQRKFWRRMKEVIGEARTRVWNALEDGLRKYTALLEERQRLIEDTTDLARQNEELKILLQEYLASKINTELEIPPTRLIRVDNRR